MHGYYVTGVEDDALYGASPLAFRAYHLLRSVMDIRTGIVGLNRRISYQMLIEACETHTPRGAGIQITRPTIKEIRVAIDSLIRAGLLARAPEPFVFSLPLASTVEARSKRTGQSEGTAATPANPHGWAISAQTGQAETAKPGIHQRKEKSMSTVATAASTLQTVDNSPGAIAAGFLETLSKRLGYPILHKHDDPRLAEWVESGLTFEALESAVAAAKAARQRDNNRAPLNPGYIAAFLPQPDDWRDSWSGIEAKGRELGLTQHPDEPAPNFKARVFAAAENQKEAA